MRIAAILLAPLAAAAVALAVYSALGELFRIEPILSVPATNIAYEAFTISVWPVYALLAITFFLWGLMGRRLSVTGCFVSAPVLAAAGLALFFKLSYGYPIGPPLGALEALFLLSLAVGFAVFAGMRRLSRGRSR